MEIHARGKRRSSPPTLRSIQLGRPPFQASAHRTLWLCSFSPLSPVQTLPFHCLSAYSSFASANLFAFFPCELFRTSRRWARLAVFAWTKAQEKGNTKSYWAESKIARICIDVDVGVLCWERLLSSENVHLVSSCPIKMRWFLTLSVFWSVFLDVISQFLLLLLCSIPFTPFKVLCRWEKYKGRDRMITVRFVVMFINLKDFFFLLVSVVMFTVHLFISMVCVSPT